MNSTTVHEIINKKEHEIALLKLTEAFKSDKGYRGTITAQELNDGSYVVLSRYEDITWVFNPKDLPNGTSAANRRVDFGNLPSQFVEAAKLCVAMRIAKGKASGTAISTFKDLQYFLLYLDDFGIKSTTKITPLVAIQYVEHCKSIGCAKYRKKQVKPLSKGTLRNRFTAVELLYNALQGTSLQFNHPWPESSAGYLAGIKQSYNTKTPKTEVIPDDVLTKVFQYAYRYLKRSDELLRVQAEVDQSMANSAHLTRHGRTIESNKALKESGYSGTLRSLRRDFSLLRTSCWLIILTTTGIRMSELGGLRANSYHTKVEEGETYYFIESKSIKTGEGETSWLCPKIAIDALKVISQITQPLRDALEAKVQEAELTGDLKTAQDLARIRQSSMLTDTHQGDNTIGIISDSRINKRLREFATAANVDWHFSSHQFRRTFAHYVVHNQLGDLRYLRDHFKHWSLDMTALYAFDDDLDLELFNEINIAYKEKREGLFEHWLDASTPIAGGLKNNVIALRNSNEAVKAYGGTAEMIKSLSSEIHVRSTGIAWCTNDQGGCASGKCEECCHSIIDDSQQPHWEAMYVQQIGLRAIADQIGPGGSATVERTIKRCEAVLREMGADMDDIKQRVAEHA